jgi:hypothetical protein
MSQVYIKLFAQKKENYKLSLDNRNKILYKDFDNQLPNGCYEIVINRSKKDKTQNQLASIFGLAIKMIIQEFNNEGIDTSYLIKSEKPTGIEVSIELLKEYLYCVCPTFNENGKRITLSKMNTKQASVFFDSIRNYAASNWNIYIPEPERL